MGKQSSLWPINPQIYGYPAQAFIDEFNQAKKETKDDPSCIHLWQVIIGGYSLTLLNH